MNHSYPFLARPTRHSGVFDIPGAAVAVAAFLTAIFLAAAGCGDDVRPRPTPAAPDAAIIDETPTTFAFPSRFADGESSVSYSGQTFRHVLINEMVGYIDRLTAEIDGVTLTPSAGDIESALDFYYQFDDATSADVALIMATTPALAQSTYRDIASGKTLSGKIAGNDAVGQHKDWAAAFVGWNADGVTSPDDLVRHWFSALDQLAVDRALGTIPDDPDGADIASVYITAEGQDLKQLIQKFLLVSIALSQGLDDYLDDATPDKGLNTSNLRDGDNPFSTLEHQWDEGFGYFGAARDYNDYSDEEIAGNGGRGEYENGYFDSDGDGKIDLGSEFNFGHAINAAKRDQGSSDTAPTDFTKEIFSAFLAGRAIISNADGELTAEQRTALLAERDIIAKGWESVIAANVIHYINDTLRDMNKFDTNDYDFAAHAKHWSELKGFALGLQFSPFSPLSDEKFAELHGHLGIKPVIEGAEAGVITAYRQALLDARALVGAAYGFDASNIGDDNGENGW